MSIVDMGAKNVIYYASINYQREMGWSAVPFFRMVDGQIIYLDSRGDLYELLEEGYAVVPVRGGLNNV